eukprot:TRINITY_DN8739_c0_g1_i1.p1 TRINITY_DN8739_c0_g1~~TRINITY_DN8739_c0_g1_i1.p1  ORF type:complete len:461 (+),score=89.52 TRINITY_DN8739_c0_g1_i1:49-1383(+)
MKHFAPVSSHDQRQSWIIRSLSSLPYSSLLEVGEELDKLLSFHRCRVVSTIPKEIWKQIFLIASTQDHSPSPTWFSVCCVCQSFNNLINQLIIEHFPLHPWILTDRLAKKLSSSLDTLNTSTHPIVGVSGLVVLTNLTRLECYLAPSGLPSLVQPMETDFSSAMIFLTNLKTLHVISDLVGNNGLEFLTGLTELVLDHSCVTDRSVSLLTNLKTLDIFNGYVTDVSLLQLTNLTHLRIFDENDDSYNCNFSDRSISGLTNLVSLAISIDGDYGITDQALVRLTKLRNLDIFGENSFTDLSVGCLKELTRLEICYNDKITDSAVLRLSKLEVLNLSGNLMITNEAVRKLETLTKLTLIDNNSIDDNGISSLCRLRSLSISGPSITDFSISKLTSLEFLEIGGSGTKITERGLLPLKNLENIVIYGSDHQLDRETANKYLRKKVPC